MKTEQVYTLLYNGTQNSEINGEFSLPDYLPDVRRILRVTSDPHVTGKYMNGERLELEGEVGMTLIYLSEEQTVCAFSASLPFSQSIAVSGLDETTIITARLQSDHSSCRLIGPRKCVLRTRPTVYLRAAAALDASPDLASLPDPARLCTHKAVIPTAELICANKEALRFAEDIAVTDGAIASVLSCSVVPCVKECRAFTDHAVCKGEFDISAFCSVITETGTDYRALHRRVPFSETLDSIGITEEFRCEPDITVTAVTPTVTEEGRNLGIDFICEAAVLCAADREAEIINDAYLPDRDVRIQSEAQSVFRPLKTVFGAFSASGSLKYDPQEPIRSVTDCQILPAIDRWEIKDGRIHLDGSLHISLICMTDESRYAPISGTIPLHWDTDGTFFPDSAEPLLMIDCSAAGYSARIDPSANAIVCDAELSVCVSVSAKEMRSLPRVLTVPSDGKIYAPPTEPLILYYPESNESVWEIAKRYRMPAETLCAANGLDASAETVTTTAPLTIPIHPLFAQMKS